MSSAHFARSPGPQVLPFARPFGPGVCKSCGCDSAECRCGCRQCRKEAKELTYTDDSQAKGRNPIVSGFALSQLSATGTGAVGATAFVGGGCCVHISLEYAPITATAQSIVAILVRDTEGTLMAWERLDPPGTHYQVKENVVTTKPGATITLIALNATVRARWCEVFSC